MIKIIKELNIEVTKPNIFQAIVAKQYDMNTRFLKVTFVDCDARIDIPVTETTKVIINAERPDGQSKGFDGVINDDGTVTVPLHSWMLELEGTVICDISVIDTANDEEKKLTTTSFTLLVEKAAYGGDDITSDPQYDVLVSLIKDIENLGTDFANAIKNTATKQANGNKVFVDDASILPHNIKVKCAGGSDLSSVQIKIKNTLINIGDLYPSGNGTLINMMSFTNIKCDGRPTCFSCELGETNGVTASENGALIYTNTQFESGFVGNYSLLRYENGNVVAGQYVLPTDTEGDIVRMTMYVHSRWTSGRAQAKDIQLVFGTERIEPKVYNANADGIIEGATASGSFMLLSDYLGPINCEYNADTKKYIDNKFAELQQAIISTIDRSD